MKYRNYWILFTSSLVFSFVQSTTFAQSLNIETTRRYVRDPVHKHHYSERIIRVAGEMFDEEFGLGLEPMEYYGTLTKSDIELKMRLAADIVPDQQVEFDLIESEYLEKIEQEVLDELAKSNGVIAKSRRESLVNRLREIQTEKENREDEVWLPHQRIIRDQVEFELKFEKKPWAMLQEPSWQEKLDLSASQQTKIRKISNELEKQISKLNAELDKQIENEIKNRMTTVIESFSLGQQETLKCKLGDNVDFEKN
jgi:hypothetical protein